MYSQITKKTFQLIFDKKYKIMKALFIPFVILTIIEYFTTANVKESIGSANYYVLIGLSLIVTIIMSITIHRILLLDEDATPKWGIYKFTGREVTFSLKAIGLGLLLGLVGMILFFITGFLGKAVQGFLGQEFVVYYNIVTIIAILAFLGMIFSRVSLVFPAVSIDNPIDFSDAFEISKDYKLLIFVCVLLIPAILGLVVGLVYGLAIGFLMGVISQKLSILLSLLNIFITVFTIGFLSTTYEYIMSKQIVKNEVKDLELKEIDFQEKGNSYVMSIDNRYNIDFNKIKEELLKQYNSLGFNDVVIDREDSWMIKNPKNLEAYIMASSKNNEYKIETFNVKEKPILNI